MKRTIFLILILLFLIIVIFTYAKTFSNDKSESEIGRYQLFQGKFQWTLIKKIGEWDYDYKEHLFMIDTKTGNCWIYEQLFFQDSLNNLYHVSKNWEDITAIQLQQINQINKNSINKE